MTLFACECPNCSSKNVRFDYGYNTLCSGYRQMHLCMSCGFSFSETKNTFLEGVGTPVGIIWKVLKARTEGMALNATCRVFGIAKNSLLFWEEKFSDLYRTLLIYSMSHAFVQSVIEGDEFYTKVNKNTPAEKSSGWTIVLMDRASRFIWQMSCGKKDAKDQSARQHAHCTVKPQITFQIMKCTPITLRPTIVQCVENVPHIEEKQTHTPNQKPVSIQKCFSVSNMYKLYDYFLLPIQLNQCQGDKGHAISNLFSEYIFG